MPFDLDLSKAQPYLKRISDVFSPAVTDQIMVYAGDRVGAAAEGVVKEDMYPPASGRALPVFYTRTRKDGTTFQSKFKSDKQQRYVMMLAKKGLLPYKRTGKLGQSIAWVTALSGNGVVMVKVGSNLTYSLYVIDDVMQSNYHRGTWEPMQQSVIDALPMLNKVAVNAIISQVNKRIKGNG
jgi:hypothetical protein